MKGFFHSRTIEIILMTFYMCGGMGIFLVTKSILPNVLRKRYSVEKMSSKFILFIVPFFIHSYVVAKQNYSFVVERVQTYFDALNSSNWLENSNKIGMGYNPVYGNLVCYTGSCQMEEFRRSILK